MTHSHGNALLGNVETKINEGDKLSFEYNGKLRVGTVETIKQENLTMNLQGAFRCFRFDKMESDITMLSTADGQSGFVASLN